MDELDLGRGTGLSTVSGLFKCQRVSDAGVWKGHSYEDVPATNIPTWEWVPTMAGDASGGSVDRAGYTYRDKLQAGGVVWGMIGEALDKNKWSDNFSRGRRVSLLAIIVGFGH